MRDYLEIPPKRSTLKISPDALFLKAKNPYEACVLLALGSFRAGVGNQISIPASEIAEMTHMSSRTVERAIKSLSSRGVIVITSRRGQWNQYSVLQPIFKK